MGDSPGVRGAGREGIVGAMHVSSMYCPTCKKQVMAHQKTANHVLHLLLTILTAGLWLLVWIAAIASPGPKRCSQCGSVSRAQKTVNVFIYGAIILFVGLMLLALLSLPRG